MIAAPERALVDELREANQNLVLAAIRADEAAETTALDLQRLAQSSRHDVLTGTLNRTSFEDCLAAAIRMAGRSRTRLAVLFIDLDGFKAVNDDEGHAAGDQALQAVTRRLQRVVRQTDTVGRYGGDEFVVLLAPITQAADASMIAEKLTEALCAPLVIGTGSRSMSASVGIAVYPEDGKDPETLIDLADSAMYRAKRIGPGRIAFHHAGAVDTQTGISTNELKVDESAIRQPVLRRDLVDANERLIVAAIASQQAGGAAEEARLRQIRFMAMVAHEMRDPLSPLRNAADLLVRVGGDNALLVKARDIINRQVDLLSRLVEDLIDGSRASAGQFRLRTAPVELVALLHLAVGACRLQTDALGQTVSVALPSILPVNGDPVRLMQIFINLLENASKYTPAGGAISLTAASQGSWIFVTVADNGIGIASDTLPLVFDLFVQEPGDRARRNGGLGIGLAVVRSLVESHGGTVVARSAGIGCGSDFVVTLPRAGEATPMDSAGTPA